MRQNQNNNQQERKRNRQNESAGAMVNDLRKTPLNPNHDYAHDIELGTYVDSRERYDNLVGDTVPNQNNVPINNTEFANELDECHRNDSRKEGTDRSTTSKPVGSKTNKK